MTKRRYNEKISTFAVVKQRKKVVKKMKKLVVILIAVVGLGILVSSCSQKHCDAYNSTNRYRAENLR
jgi:hypothetical protein